MEQLYGYVPRELVTFILVTLFSLLIGLSQRRISLKREGETTLFGTDRTFTFIGILGYLLYILDPTGMRLFGRRRRFGTVAGTELLCEAGSISRFWRDDYYYRLNHLLSGSHCVHPTFLVLCHGDCDGTSAYRTKAYLYGICPADEK